MTYAAVIVCTAATSGEMEMLMEVAFLQTWQGFSGCWRLSGQFSEWRGDGDGADRHRIPRAWCVTYPRTTLPPVSGLASFCSPDALGSFTRDRRVADPAWLGLWAIRESREHGEADHSRSAGGGLGKGLQGGSKNGP